VCADAPRQANAGLASQYNKAGRTTDWDGPHGLASRPARSSGTGRALEHEEAVIRRAEIQSAVERREQLGAVPGHKGQDRIDALLQPPVGGRER